MKSKQELVLDLLRMHLAEAKVGIIVKGIDGIFPEEIIKVLACDKIKSHLYASVIGYVGVTERTDEFYDLTDSIEKAVLWRSMPECAGSIIVFIRNDADKLHSLAEFEIITIRDITCFLIEQQNKSENNIPTNNFWNALKETSDYYTFDAVYEYIEAIVNGENPTEDISRNMWRLNLLPDEGILGTKENPRERLAKNRDLIFAIGQLSEDSRKRLSRSLVRSKTDDKNRLQKAYNSLQNFYKYGNRKMLEELDFETVRDLFSASQKTEKRKNDKDLSSDNGAIRPKELEDLISRAVVSGNEEEQKDLKDLLDKLTDYYNFDTEENDSIPVVGGIFEDRDIILESHQSDLRKLVGRFCNESAWGGIMRTSESVLKDAISSDIDEINIFDPEDYESCLSFTGGDDNQPLFDFIIQFDHQFDEKGLELVERFSPIIKSLKEKRSKMLSSIDMIMYYPVLLFGSSEEYRLNLINYIEAWGQLYHAFCENESIMRGISPAGTRYIAKALLSLDLLYVKTPTEWKSILLPLHPVYLWRYYEIFKMLPKKRAILSDEDKKILIGSLSSLPQLLNYVVANEIVTNNEDRILPCSGSIEMLPTYENKTNRYLGNDGTESVEEILTRWIGFAPYTRNEVRICSVDAPDLISILRQIKSFMDKNLVRRVVYDVYLTRKQNGNVELSELDYSGKDYEVGEYIRSGKISISIRNIKELSEVKLSLTSRPVHVAFYFDQLSYSIEYGSCSPSLYITPLVITYDYDYDEIQHKGSIYPSSDMDSGFISDYYKVMRLTDIVSNQMNPRTTYNGNANITSVVSTIKDKQTQWLVVADRDTNNYQPEKAIPIGEMQFEKRMVSIWAADNSRVITQYLKLLREYNLYPKKETFIGILRRFGHIASNGLISIPRFGTDIQAIENKKKGLLGTLFAASWYMKQHDDALVASLDDDKARKWLQNNKYGNERADLIGLYFDESTNTLHIEPIEVKTRDESPDANICRDDSDSKFCNITGHAVEQIGTMIGILKEIFSFGDSQIDMFTAARREVLKYQIVSECFRNVHRVDWQKKWYAILKKAFSENKERQLNISFSGLLLHIKLNEMSGGKHVPCKNPDFDDCKIDYWVLTAKEIQRGILGDEFPTRNDASFNLDLTENNGNDELKSNTVILDSNVGISTGSGQSNDFDCKFKKDVEEEFNVAEKNVEFGFNQNSVNVESIEIKNNVNREEINQLVRDFKQSCRDYRIGLKECNANDAVVGPSVIRLRFKLERGQSLQGLKSHIEDISREMKRTGTIIQQIPNSDELFLDVPRLQREKVLFRDVISSLPNVVSPEQLYFPLGRTPNGEDIFEDLGQMPHMLVGGSTGSGKSVFLFSMLAALLMTHPRKDELQLVLSSSKLEDFIFFENLPHLYSGHIISNAEEATSVIKEVIYEESERRGELLVEKRVPNIIEYNKVVSDKLAPIVVVIDEFADLADQLESKKDQIAFYNPVQRIAQVGRSRGIHLVVCTQRPEAKLVPSTIKAQLNGRVALRVNDAISSRMIIEEPDAQYLQKHGDMIYRNGDVIERAQGYLIETNELEKIISDVIEGKL